MSVPQFTEVNPATLTAEQQAAWRNYLAAKEAMGEALQTSAPAGHKILFSAKYNKLKLGLAPVSVKAVSGKAGGLDAWLAKAAANGQRV